MGLSSTGLPSAPAGTLGVLGFLVAPYRVEMLNLEFRLSRVCCRVLCLSGHKAVGSWGCRVLGFLVRRLEL